MTRQGISEAEWRAELERKFADAAAKEPLRGCLWKQHELELLARYHGVLSQRKIAELLGRTRASVNSKLRSM